MNTHRIPAGLNLGIAVTQLGTMLGILWMAARVSHWWAVALLALGYGVVMNSAYAMLHEAEHGILHPHRGVNDFVGTVLALFFPAPFHLIRQGHIGHHIRNRSDDEAEQFLWRECRGEITWGPIIHSIPAQSHSELLLSTTSTAC